MRSPPHTHTHIHAMIQSFSQEAQKNIIYPLEPFVANLVGNIWLSLFVCWGEINCTFSVERFNLLYYFIFLYAMLCCIFLTTHVCLYAIVDDNLWVLMLKYNRINIKAWCSQGNSAFAFYAPGKPPPPQHVSTRPRTLLMQRCLIS